MGPEEQLPGPQGLPGLPTLAGSSIGFVRKIVWALFGFTAETSLWIRVPTYIAFIFPTYQTMLTGVFGTLFGEFRFFWAKERRCSAAAGWSVSFRARRPGSPWKAPA